MEASGYVPSFVKAARNASAFATVTVPFYLLEMRLMFVAWALGLSVVKPEQRQGADPKLFALHQLVELLAVASITRRSFHEARRQAGGMLACRHHASWWVGDG
jgi:hypothetical protein